MRREHLIVAVVVVLLVAAVVAVYVAVVPGLSSARRKSDAGLIEARMDQITSGGEENSKPAATGMQEAIQRLRAAVARDPKDVDSWQNLGWAYMHIRQPADAVIAYRHAVALSPGAGDYLSALAEAEVQAGDGRITPATLAEFRHAAAQDPANARARFYLALYKDQQGDHRGAVADWITLLKSAPANAAWAPEVRGVVEQVAKEEHLDIAAQLPPRPGAMADAMGR